jgi:hypothetical protein
VIFCITGKKIPSARNITRIAYWTLLFASASIASEQIDASIKL